MTFELALLLGVLITLGVAVRALYRVEKLHGLLPPSERIDEWVEVVAQVHELARLVGDMRTRQIKDAQRKFAEDAREKKSRIREVDASLRDQALAILEQSTQQPPAPPETEEEAKARKKRELYKKARL